MDGECRPASAKCGEGTLLRDDKCVAADPDAGATDVSDGTADAPEDADGGAETGDDCVLREEEWCDGRDNDCDGEIDEDHVCPDWSVRYTDPFYDAVYFYGMLSSTCNDDALQQIWPTMRDDYYTGFPCSVRRYTFRLDDNRLYYLERHGGIYYLDDEGYHINVATPPCGEDVGPIFSFDGDGRIHYRCDNTLRRGNGELVELSIQELAVTLDDGRIVVMSRGPRGDIYAVLDEDGNELSSLDPHDKFVGEVTLIPLAATKRGNTAYVLLERRWGQRQNEYVAYRLNEQNEWQLMRRVEVDFFGSYALVISDGTILSRRHNTSNWRGWELLAYRPDTGREVVLDEDDETPLMLNRKLQLLVGPRDTPQPQ